MLFFITVLLLLILMIPLVKWTKAGKDLFNPVTISFFFLIITSVPYLFSDLGRPGKFENFLIIGTFIPKYKENAPINKITTKYIISLGIFSMPISRNTCGWMM